MKRPKRPFPSSKIPPADPLRSKPPKREPVEAPKTILAEFRNWGVPFNIQKCETAGAPNLMGYKCMAAWKVLHTDEALLEFMELEDKLGNVHTLYHGTPAENIASIVNNGLQPGYGGMFGGGIYMGGPGKAFGYTQHKWRTARGTQQRAYYLLKVRAILGKVKECRECWHKGNLKDLRKEGFDSVAGIRGWTHSWGGTLRGDEFVVYSPSQVMVENIFEYQALEKELEQKTSSGICEILYPAPSPFGGKGMSAFRDLSVKAPCGKVAYRSVQLNNGISAWVCNDCIAKHRLKIGSWIEVQNNLYWRGKGPSVRVRITGIRQ